MVKARLIAVVTEKRRKDISTQWEIMEMRYKIKDNMLCITDHRGYIVDFDLDEFDVEIKSVDDIMGIRKTYEQGSKDMRLKIYSELSKEAKTQEELNFLSKIRNMEVK